MDVAQNIIMGTRWGANGLTAARASTASGWPYRGPNRGNTVTPHISRTGWYPGIHQHADGTYDRYGRFKPFIHIPGTAGLDKSVEMVRDQASIVQMRPAEINIQDHGSKRRSILVLFSSSDRLRS